MWCRLSVTGPDARVANEASPPPDTFEEGTGGRRLRSPSCCSPEPGARVCWRSASELRRHIRSSFRSIANEA